MARALCKGLESSLSFLVLVLLRVGGPLDLALLFLLLVVPFLVLLLLLNTPVDIKCLHASGCQFPLPLLRLTLPPVVVKRLHAEWR